MNKQKLNIKQWSKADRPREKMMAKGSEALSDAELLGILIGSGNTEESAVELMRRILATCDNNLNELEMGGTELFFIQRHGTGQKPHHHGRSGTRQAA